MIKKSQQFIKLKTSNGGIICVNSMLITSIAPLTTTEGSEIRVWDNGYHVKETPEQILKMIDDTDKITIKYD